jgi:hypothetical protein
MPCARDPFLHLKNGSAQDDASQEQLRNSNYKTIPLAPKWSIQLSVTFSFNLVHPTSSIRRASEGVADG